MRSARIWMLAALSGAGGLVASAPRPTQAQAVAFAPVIGTVPEGVGMNVTPVVSADRRYVRIGVSAGFSAVDSFQNINIPLAAVAGGPGPGGFAGGGGLRSVGVAMGMDGPIAANPAANSGLMLGPYPGFAGSPSFDQANSLDEAAWTPAPRRTRTTRPRSVRARQAQTTTLAAQPKPATAPPVKRPAR